MHVMQYEIALPADYDMEIVRRRVQSRSHLLDTTTGLGVKAYCIRERGINGAPRNEYAPLYIWEQSAPMNAFLWGTGFRGLCDSFGRPRVQQWMGVGFARGPAHREAVCAASRHLTPISDATDLGSAVERALDESTVLATNADLHSTVIAADTTHWQLVRFCLWRSPRLDRVGTHYTVVHVSTPSLASLPSPRAW